MTEFSTDKEKRDLKICVKTSVLISARNRNIERQIIRKPDAAHILLSSCSGSILPLPRRSGFFISLERIQKPNQILLFLSGKTDAEAFIVKLNHICKRLG